MSSPIRRSARARKVSKKYSNDGWSKETLRLLRESSESSNPTSIDTDAEASENDGEFDEHALQTATADGIEAEDSLSVASGSSKSSHVATPENEEEDDQDVVLDDEDVVAAVTSNSAKAIRWKASVQTRSRGVNVIERGRSVKNFLWEGMFGPEMKDLKIILRTKNRWLYQIRDTTLPSFKTLAEAKKTEWSENDTVKQDGNRAIAAHLEVQQNLKPASIDEARTSFQIRNSHEHQIVLGPHSDQKVYDVPFWSWSSIGEAWRKSSQDSGSFHNGWLLNAGEKPQCMAWASNQDASQFLAITCRSTPEQRMSVPTSEKDTSPAFTPSTPYPTVIQIWKFNTVSAQSTDSSLDLISQPQLTRLFLCKYGDVKAMTWQSKLNNIGVIQDSTSLGLLTILTTDGCVRLIDVPNSDSQLNKSYCSEILAPMLKLVPPTGSIFTCFSFASPTDLIIGTSSGHIHMYNLSNIPSPQTSPEPYFTCHLHPTYIMSICTLEDAYSHFIATSSAAGTLQIVDLRSPTQDILTLQRARVPTRNLIYNPHCRAIITTNDSSGNSEARGTAQTGLVAHNFRHFYQATALSKYPEGNGTATALAGSQLHPCVLVGNSSGTVWAQNVARRMLPQGKPGVTSDAGSWVQKVVEYAWIPQPSLSDQTPAAVNINTTNAVDNTPHHNEARDRMYHGAPVRPGISRMYHGFKPEKLDLSNAGSQKRKVFSIGAAQVVFEEEQAVTAIEWNPNAISSSWAAVAWGSGVVMVSDLGHDAV